MREVRCLETKAIYVFDAKSAHEALEKMKYTLAINDKEAEKCEIYKTVSGMNLYLIYKGRHYVSKVFK